LAQNPNVLYFDFTQKCEFVTKTNRNSIFLGREADILDWLYTIVLYKNFMGFLKKNQILAQDPKVLAFGFTEKCHFVAKNWAKLRLSWP
jgi:hypothetical protein